MIIEVLKSILLGIIQGITEFVPVSSSGHLVLSNYFLKFDLQEIRYELILHLGTLISVLIYFRNELSLLSKSLLHWQDKSEQAVSNRNLGLYLIVSTFVTGVIGISVKSSIESIFYIPIISAIMLSVTGLTVLLIDLIKRKNPVDIYRIGINKAIFVGALQTLSLMPGISRSGMTIFAAILIGIERKDAARYSFLLSIPAILGASLFDLKLFLTIPLSEVPYYLGGFIAAAVTGYFFIAILMEMIKKRNLKIFSIYCWIVSVASIIAIVFFNI